MNSKLYIFLILIISCFACKNSSSNETITNYEIPNNPNLDYEILDKIDLISGEGKFADVLIKTPQNIIDTIGIEELLRQIMKEENLISISAYSTNEAYKAAYSESYKKANPNAYEDGYLGYISEKGVFIE